MARFLDRFSCRLGLAISLFGAFAGCRDNGSYNNAKEKSDMKEGISEKGEPADTLPVKVPIDKEPQKMSEGAKMVLTTEQFGDNANVTAAEIDRILSEDSFGKFAVLSAAKSSFIQAGNDWNPGPDCEAFIKKHKSDPWILEYRDEKAGKLFRAATQLTLAQVRRAFVSYHAGAKEWRIDFIWQEVKK